MNEESREDLIEIAQLVLGLLLLPVVLGLIAAIIFGFFTAPLFTVLGIIAVVWVLAALR